MDIVVLAAVVLAAIIFPAILAVVTFIDKKRIRQ